MESEFKKELAKKLSTEKKLAESSIKLYLRNLEKLNDNQPIKNLKFLNNIEDITKKLTDYKENTKRGFFISITSVLSLDKTTKAKQKLYDKYFELMMQKNKELKKEEGENIKSDTQEKNWLSWDEVEKYWTDLKSKVDSFKSKQSENQYNILLQYVILSLYYCLPPRRNEYQHMVIINKSTPDLTKDKNYLDWTNKQMIFNKFKTSKKDGSITIDLPEKLIEVLSIYIKYHPLIKGKITSKFTEVPFLVFYDGKPLEKVNSITRILNKIFGKSVGSSMLRHIFLSNKYKDVTAEQKNDALLMSHSINQQKDYIKN